MKSNYLICIRLQVEVTGMFCYSSDFPNDAWTVSLDVGYDFSYGEVDTVLSFCGMFSYSQSLVPQSGV